MVSSAVQLSAPANFPHSSIIRAPSPVRAIGAEVTGDHVDGVLADELDGLAQGRDARCRAARAAAATGPAGAACCAARSASSCARPADAACAAAAAGRAGRRRRTSYAGSGPAAPPSRLTMVPAVVVAVPAPPPVPPVVVVVLVPELSLLHAAASSKPPIPKPITKRVMDASGVSQVTVEDGLGRAPSSRSQAVQHKSTDTIAACHVQARSSSQGSCQYTALGREQLLLAPPRAGSTAGVRGFVLRCRGFVLLSACAALGCGAKPSPARRQPQCRARPRPPPTTKQPRTCSR